MVHHHNGSTGSRTFWLLFGFFLVFIGFLSIFTGIIQVISAEDVNFLVQVEEMLFIQSTQTANSMILFGVLRFFIGILFVIIGNSFMLRAGVDDRICHPRMGDFNAMRRL